MTAKKSKAPKHRLAHAGENARQDDRAQVEKAQLDRELDLELADSFPASDPPAVTQRASKAETSPRKPSEN
ncbi:MAG TPA: hypothetical protein VLZ74_02685 [Methylocella sp.]|nr:hypothetical protein [Methylocella sp.]